MEAKCPKRLRRCSSSSSTYTADATFRSDLLLERGSWGLSPVVCVAQALVTRHKRLRCTSNGSKTVKLEPGSLRP